MYNHTFGFVGYHSDPSLTEISMHGNTKPSKDESGRITKHSEGEVSQTQLSI